jgi:hypothetical protein
LYDTKEFKMKRFRVNFVLAVFVWFYLLFSFLPHAQSQPGASGNATTEFRGKKYEIKFNEKGRSSPEGMIIIEGTGKHIIHESQVFKDSTGQTYTFPSESLIDKSLPPTRTKLKISQLDIDSDHPHNSQSGEKASDNTNVGILLLDASTEDAKLEFLLRGMRTFFPLVFAPNAEITFLGKVIFRSYIFESHDSSPLTIRIDSNDIGYTYISGQGTIKKGDLFYIYPPTLLPETNDKKGIDRKENISDYF